MALLVVGNDGSEVGVAALLIAGGAWGAQAAPRRRRAEGEVMTTSSPPRARVHQDQQCRGTACPAW